MICVNCLFINGPGTGTITSRGQPHDQSHAQTGAISHRPRIGGEDRSQSTHQPGKASLFQMGDTLLHYAAYKGLKILAEYLVEH